MVKNTWHACKNVLFIRPDNMGDVIMMTPALRAVKQTFKCRITLLTSRMGSVITPHIPYIDQTLIHDLPWVKTTDPADPVACNKLIEKLRSLKFDGAIISTVYSQNPLPAALMAFMAGIPMRAACCRENPYDLLTHWIPDDEPYSCVRHQVIRELNLVANIGAHPSHKRLSLSFNKEAADSFRAKLISAGVDVSKPWIVAHPGVSEKKREYPEECWVEAVKKLFRHTGMQVLITGTETEKPLAGSIQKNAGDGVFSVAGLFSIEEFIALIADTRLVVTVNTATVHIAAATNTPLVVLYARTNPQHTPWKVDSVVLPFSVPVNLQSKNEVIRYVHKKYYEKRIPYPSAGEIADSARKLLAQPGSNVRAIHRPGIAVNDIS